MEIIIECVWVFCICVLVVVFVEFKGLVMWFVDMLDLRLFFKCFRIGFYFGYSELYF